MSRNTSVRPAFKPAAARQAGTAAVAFVSLSLALAGCGGSIGKIINTVHALANAAGNLKNLSAEIQKGENATYEATYKITSTGSSASTFTFAQEPGGKYAYIAPGSNGSGGTDFVANGKDQYTCSQDSGGAKWSCIETPEPSGTAGLEGDAFYGYSGAYFYSVIESLQVVAAVEGFKVTNSTSSVNGIGLKCVTLTGKENGQSLNDKWCITNDGIMGLVNSSSSGGSSSSNNSSFEITKLSTSPSSSVFQPPAGASVTTETT
jgi:hypothetical protein